MKVLAFLMIAIVMLATFVSSTPFEKPKKSTCQKACTDDYTPICGRPSQGKGHDITFGNKCALDNYNCEKNDPQSAYVKSSEGECPGGKAPVRF